MLGLARKSTVESLQEEKEDLEAEVQNKQVEVSEQRVRAVEAEEAHAAALEAGEFPTLEEPNLGSEVITLDEPRTVWKRTRYYIVEMVVPAGETVVHPRSNTENKKRVSRAYVKQFYDPVSGEEDDAERDRAFHRDFTYEQGTFVEPRHGLDTSVWNVCTDGIHCFRTREEAENYW